MPSIERANACAGELLVDLRRDLVVVEDVVLLADDVQRLGGALEDILSESFYFALVFVDSFFV